MGRHGTHPVQDYFVYKKLENKSICKTCDKVFTGNHSTNLEKHFQRDHKKIFDEIVNKKEQELSYFKRKNLEENRQLGDTETAPPAKLRIISDLITPLSVNNINITKEKLKLACLELVTVNGRPFSIIEDSGFRKIIDPIIEGISKKERITINKNNIRDMVAPSAKQCKENIIQDVRNRMISLKVDAATRIGRSFLGINIQFIKDGTIHLRTLAVRELKEKHTAIYLKSVILEVLGEFNISLNQVYTFTSDNGANMVKCVERLKSDMNLTEQLFNQIYNESVEDDENDQNIMDTLYTSLKEMQGNFSENQNSDVAFFQSITHGVRCGAHTIQLAVFDAIKKDQSVENIISKARAVCKKLRTPTISMLLKVILKSVFY